nr:transposase [Desulfobulbus sp.]
MEKTVRRQYTDEFKEGAVNLVTDQGYKISEAARNLGIHTTQLRRWITQMLGCSKDGKPTFIRGHEINSPEPFDQGNFGGMKQSVRSYRNLMTTLGTLVQMARSDGVGFCAAAYGTLKSIGPAHLDQNAGTCALRTGPFLPF